MRYKLVIFDMDGTILDTLQDLQNAVNAALEKHHLPKRSYEEVRRFVGNGVRKLVERAVPAGTDSALIDAVFQDFKAYYAEHCADTTRPYEGIVELLGELRKRGLLTAVVSNKLDSGVQALCKQYFDGLFDAAIGDQEGIGKKPSPDMVNLVLEKLHCDKKDAVYVGDSEVDYETAIRSNLEYVLVEWGFRDRKMLEELGANRFAADCNNLLEELVM